ncbi:Holliday junction resolvase RuvX [Selenihalanaerobacter shriftii]|uniref:RNase H-fold protein, predicted Holliday junction resolvase n=1 Tax=Selenihalanaerobacter shriftii TaxID=142842 RepID=A0A1T4KXE2_9FIRM|nr:Holliday junction resolvase RuvX [Selenihalanaerobacter shriftii]SJZ47018.1 RNase H-fold protein, predicted Holliday junction resolvase [Selenihalanaerobacter shriftii]
MILGIDPGREKCGLALTEETDVIIKKEVVETSNLVEMVKELLSTHQIDLIVIGDGTLSQDIINKFKKSYRKEVRIEEVDETNSTLEARELYWQKNPPQGWRRFIPTSFQTPPCPVDDYVAVILIERYLNKGK